MVLEPVLRIKLLSVFRDENDSRRSNAWVMKKRVHHPSAQAFAPLFRVDDDIAKPGKCDLVGDRSGEPDLPPVMKQSDANGLADGSLDLPTSPRCSPIRGLQERENCIYIEA